MRINKYLAACGLGSRRKCEELVVAGKVFVDGKKVDALSFDVSEKAKVEVDGLLVGQKSFEYLMMFKPKGFVTTKNDDMGRKTVMDLLPEGKKHLNPVGRLDYDTEGLLLFTNDGDFANMLSHPSSEIEKTYQVRVKGPIVESELAVLRKGVVIDGKRTSPCKAKVLRTEGGKTVLELVIHEGRNREIRKMMEAIGKDVEFLKRTGYGTLSLGGLSRGKTRELRAEEIAELFALIGGGEV